MGPLAAWILAALEGAVVGGAAGILGAALAGMGIPRDSVIKYESAVNAGRFLVLAHGDAELVDHARTVLASTSTVHLATHASKAGRRERSARSAAYTLRNDALALVPAPLLQASKGGPSGGAAIA
jgi:hypothetical protein